jgi:LuxR family transcriptional regulator, maltose regulon positive regulatory protein
MSCQHVPRSALTILWFTADEAATYLNHVIGLRLVADVVGLEERTVGWIASLQLAALSLQGRADVQRWRVRYAACD